jgi:hypothetical protein
MIKSTAAHLPKATTEQLIRGIVPYGWLEMVDLAANTVLLRKPSEVELYEVAIVDPLTETRYFPRDMARLKELSLVRPSSETVIVCKDVLAQAYYLKA